MNHETAGWDTADQRIDRLNDLVGELDMIDRGISDEEVVLAAMATSAPVRSMLGGIMRPEVFTDDSNRRVFVHLTGGDDGHQPMPAKARQKLEFFELGGMHVSAMDAMRTGRELLAQHEYERLCEIAEATPQSPSRVQPEVMEPPAQQLDIPAFTAVQGTVPCKRLVGREL